MACSRGYLRLFVVPAPAAVGFLLFVGLDLVEPVAVEIVSFGIVRDNPNSLCVWWTDPVAFTPLVFFPFRVPVAANPDVLRRRPHGCYIHNSGRWRRTDLYADRNLSAKRRFAHQEERSQ